MLPAREGDCLWIRYGARDAPHQILIDGGRSETYLDIKARLAELPERQRHFELFVITHVDRDHIEGALALLEDPDLELTFKEIWFNGYDHLKDVELETFGALQGERLTKALLSRKDRWNAAFESGPAKILSDGRLPRISLSGGLSLTLLSPDSDKLARLSPRWGAECAEAGIQPGGKEEHSEPEGLESFGGIPDVERLATLRFKPDTALPNGSSIALLAEFEGVRALLAADAHVDRLISSLAMLLGDKDRVRLDAFKLSHHGSSGNTSRELLELVECSRYLISTNGAYFRHPNDAAIARVLKFGGPKKTLYFNYGSDYSSPWLDPTLQTTYGYTTKIPSTGNGSLVVVLQN